MSRPAVSVILPFHNAAETLDPAIVSIRSQTFADWEMVAFDDGSTDDSGAVARKHAADDPRIRVLSSTHTGIVNALHQACAEARGTYLARMDADDTAHPERLARQVTLLDADPDIALCGTRVRMSGEGIGIGRRRYESWINALISHDDLVRELFVECPLPHPTFCMRRDVYEAVGGYQDHGWAEDYDLVMRIWRAGGRLAKVPEILLDWNHRPGRLSMVDARYSETAFRALKRHYLAESYLKGRDTFHQWGAGEVGKRWLREWGNAAPAAVVDISPRKIGRRIHGMPVITPEALPPPGATFIVVAVGTPGARDDIRARLAPRGYRELQDYLFLA